MIETHAHLYADAFDKDRSEMMDRAIEAGVEKFYMPNIDSESIDGMLEVEDKYPTAIATMGLHPCSIKKDFQKELYQVEDWLAKRKFVAIGEIGLDFYWDTTYKEQQIEAFKIQIEWAKKYKIPIIIHCRDSFDETLELVKTNYNEDLRGVFHCFSGTAQEAKDIADLNFYIGIGGIVTFKNGGLAEHIPEIDLDNVVLETDCPYLTPTPHRGKRNEPVYLDIIAQKIADLKQMPKSDLIAKTSSNAQALFS
ncbi:TatD family hydrolase [Marivirga atlantica]|jgi:TatD DNase family protein|uniref:TatD family hydrolase n=1 Tax=Marivirga atlantica TaxID=1548457 RepID=A0A937DL82_9BACT|nr:TatD family hydrolase [Marivirga atlantica]MBL0767001.1 TatD family hydrolase [Marivirga atlantica]